MAKLTTQSNNDLILHMFEYFYNQIYFVKNENLEFRVYLITYLSNFLNETFIIIDEKYTNATIVHNYLKTLSDQIMNFFVIFV